MSKHWSDPLASQFRSLGRWPDDILPEPKNMFNTELGLHLLDTLGHLPASALPMLLKGHVPVQDHGQRIRIAIARRRIGFFSRDPIWRDHLARYSELPESWRGYSIDPSNPNSVPQQKRPSVGSTRYDVYDKVLSSPPEKRENPKPQAGPGHYAFRCPDKTGQDQIVHVTIDEEHLAHVPPLEQHEPISPRERCPIRLNLQDLRKTARWMDEQEQRLPENRRGNYQSRLSATRLSLQLFDEQGKLHDAEFLNLDGMFHLVGMVSSGKTALADVITAHLAQNGKRVTLLVDNVMGALDRTRQFNELHAGWAAPILGRDVFQHLTRLQAAVMEGQSIKMPWAASPHIGFRSISPTCPLMALRDRGEKDEWIDPAYAPCEDLYKEDNGKRQHFSCPFMAVCPRHQAQRDLISAPIWIATPESLIYSSPPEPLAPPDLPRDMDAYFARLAYYRSDLTIVDEADTIQLRLDDIFSKGGDLQNWFIKVKQANDVPSIARRFDLQTANDLQVNYYVSEMSKRLPQMFYFLKKPLGKQLRQTYFSNITLFDRLARDLSGKVDDIRDLRELLDKVSTPAQKTRIERYRQSLEPLMFKVHRVETDYEELETYFDELVRELPNGRNPRPAQVRQPFVSFVDTLRQRDQEYRRLRGIFDSFIDRRETSDADAVRELERIAAQSGEGGQEEEEIERKQVRAWIEKHTAATSESQGPSRELIDRMRLALAVNQAEIAFNQLRYAALDEQRGMFIGAPRAYINIAPHAPMGNIVAFLYDAPPDDQPARLQIIDCRGIGRWVLLNWHRLFEADGTDGPNVLLMSGTSWADKSPDAHVQQPVDGILNASNEEVAAIRQSVFEYIPVRDDFGQPIAISGISDPEERRSALAKMTRQLAKPGGLLEEQMASLPEDRRRIVLFTGSYDECEEIQSALVQFERWRSSGDQHRVLRLIPDHEPHDPAGTIRRGRVHTFAQSDAEILIAPVKGIERGHNILNKKNQAAFGLAVFLVRVHPPPNDLGYPIHMMNRWAINQFEDMKNQELTTIIEQREQFESAARRQWRRLLRMPLIYQQLEGEDHPAVTWNLLVSIYQVVGRLVRGGVPAKVIFCDGKFMPKGMKFRADTEQTSLLLALEQILKPYFDDAESQTPEERRNRAIAQALYGGMYPAIERMNNSLR